MSAAYRASSVSGGRDLAVTDSYRSYAAQVSTKARKGNLAATPGTSNHGWGLAIDFGGGIQTTGSTAHAWMLTHAGHYGWVHPAWARPGGSKPEPWHWEYVGTTSTSATRLGADGMSTPVMGHRYVRPACSFRLDLPWLRDTRTVSRTDADAMRAFCAGCPLLAACSADAATETGGWWAGRDRGLTRVVVAGETPALPGLEDVA
nr:M15 family metallopeptidase [Angustibacter aerolatus]